MEKVLGIHMSRVFTADSTRRPCQREGPQARRMQRQQPFRASHAANARGELAARKLAASGGSARACNWSRSARPPTATARGAACMGNRTPRTQASDAAAGLSGNTKRSVFFAAEHNHVRSSSPSSRAGPAATSSADSTTLGVNAPKRILPKQQWDEHRPVEITTTGAVEPMISPPGSPLEQPALAKAASQTDSGRDMYRADRECSFTIFCHDGRYVHSNIQKHPIRPQQAPVSRERPPTAQSTTESADEYAPALTCPATARASFARLS
jgi:hypothetical protein